MCGAQGDPAPLRVWQAIKNSLGRELLVGLEAVEGLVEVSDDVVDFVLVQSGTGLLITKRDLSHQPLNALYPAGITGIYAIAVTAEHVDMTSGAKVVVQRFSVLGLPWQ